MSDFLALHHVLAQFLPYFAMKESILTIFLKKLIL